MDKLQYLYTWKDIDRIFQYFVRQNKYSFFNDVEVYSDHIVVLLDDLSKKEEAKGILKELLNSHYDQKNDSIHLDLFDESLYVQWDEDDEKRNVSGITPLFSNVIYSNVSYGENILQNEKITECPVIAFHSYKGGVGRTLSLIAFAKAWSENKPLEKLLIVDSDIEAPGLTWLLDDEGTREGQVSYLDFLEMVQSSELDSEKNKAMLVRQMRLQTMKMDTGKRVSEHFFLPTYRYEEQLLDIYANPESIARGYKKKYLLAEKLSELGKALGASAVLVDLRAGISEFSAPLLLDPRVKKYIVTSTSYQSIKGTQMILRELCKGLPIKPDSTIPNILLTMITSEVDVADIKGMLLQGFEDQEQSYTDNAIIDLPFAGELVHLTSLSQILDKLTGRKYYDIISNIIKDSYMHDEGDDNMIVGTRRNDIIHAIHDLAEKQINAEINAKFNILMTKPITNLIKKYNFSVPQANVLGAKGAGKTFLYRELLKGKRWEVFCEHHGGMQSDKKTYILPLIAPKNAGEMKEIIHDSIINCRSETELVSDDNNYWYKNEEALSRGLKEENDLLAWKNIWKSCLLNGICKDHNESLDHLEQALEEKNVSLMLVVDGLEEIFENTLSNKNEKLAVRALVQGLMNDLKLQYPHIGMLVFLRKDLSNNSIETNKEQFEGQYKNFALDWTHDEALRLALWLIDQAVPTFCKNSIKIDIAPKEYIKENLDKFWGLKLGKKESNEAYSSRWILAALSDFNSQLQARDIVRFLEKATENTGNEKYSDRIIMPREIKSAVQACSDAKVDEIKQEMKNVKSAIEKLESAPDEKKLLPFSIGTFDLTQTEETMMIQQGLLKIDDGKYYIPEIIRHSLKFKYEKGARPKVLSLLKVQ